MHCKNLIIFAGMAASSIRIFKRQFAERRFIFSLGAVALAMLAVVLFASPLFQTLSFEYSAVSAIVLSLVAGIYCVLAIERNPVGLLMQPVTALLPQTLIFASVPFLVSALSTLWLPNCSFRDGVGFYIQVALPSALLGMLFGSFFGTLLRRKKWAVGCFVLFWISSLVLSLLPGYYNPQLFAYGWSYGFFPGFIWDESITLLSGYWWARLESLTLAITLLSLVRMLHIRSLKLQISRASYAATALLLIVYIGLLLSEDANRVTSSHARVEAYLSAKLEVNDACLVQFRGGSLTAEEKAQLKEDIRWYIHDVSERFQLKHLQHVTIYLYPSADALNEYVGTRSASIAKPWLSELHIAKENLESMKHELTHVLLREIGSFPFYASWSTGLTEGAAMSVEPRYDGVQTLDEYAARILQMHFATGVSDVMSFTGFAANASAKSYILAGSFSSYLLRNYGAAKFIDVYRHLDFESAYHKPLRDLEAAWKDSLRLLMAPLDHYDSLRIRYYFDRSSIFFQPCVRRIGKLNRLAEEALKREDYTEADSLYRTVFGEAGGVSALRGRAISLLGLGRRDDALRVFTDSKSIDAIKQRPAITLLEGDLYTINLHPDSAQSYYLEAEKFRLNEGYFTSAYTKRHLYHSTTEEWWPQYLIRQYLNPNDLFRLSYLFDALWTSQVPQVQASAYFVEGDIYEESGLFYTARRCYESAAEEMKKCDSMDAADSLFCYFISRRLPLEDRSMFGLPTPSYLARTAEKELAEEVKKRRYLSGNQF